MAYAAVSVVGAGLAAHRIRDPQPYVTTEEPLEDGGAIEWRIPPQEEDDLFTRPEQVQTKMRSVKAATAEQREQVEGLATEVREVLSSEASMDPIQLESVLGRKKHLKAHPPLHGCQIHDAAHPNVCELACAGYKP